MHEHGAKVRNSPAFENRKGWGSLSHGSARLERLGQPPTQGAATGAVIGTAAGGIVLTLEEIGGALVFLF